MGEREGVETIFVLASLSRAGGRFYYTEREREKMIQFSCCVALSGIRVGE